MGMIQVYSHCVGSHFAHSGIEMMSFIVLQRNNGSFEDTFCIKDTIDGEHIFGYSAYTFGHIFSVSFCAWNDEIEFIAFVQGGNFAFKTFKRGSQSRNELERVLCGCFFY